MSNDRRQSQSDTRFTSSRATRIDARARSRHNDRSRSPKGDTGRRYERNERERNEQEQSRGHDLYRPGQSPSKDMIPAPVRTSNVGPPFSPQIRSPLNDSHRPNIVRSPSESSPYQSNRPVTSRTNTASDPSRPPPEVEIRILGLAAKTNQERKQREEDAKMYLAKKAVQKAQTIPEHDPMEMAPSEDSVVSTALSWKDKAEATDVSKSNQVGTADGNPMTMTQLLADSLKKLIDEVSEVSSLKSQRDKSKAKLDKAKAGFEKSRDHHAGFPSIKETHNISKKAAEKDYKNANEQLEQKDDSLYQLATLVAEQVIPSILGGGSRNEEQQKTQDRISALENTCRKYDELLQQQRSFLEDQQKASRLAAQESERKYKAIAEDLRLIQSDVAKQRLRQDKFFLRQNDFAITTKNLSAELGKVREIVAAVSGNVTTISNGMPTNLQHQLQRLDELEQLRAKVNTVGEQSVTTQSGLANLTTTVNTLDQSMGTLKNTFDAHVSASHSWAQEQNQLRGTLSEVHDRVGVVESKLLDTKETDELKQRITQIETAPPTPAPATGQTVDQSKIVELESLAEKVKPLLSQFEAFGSDTSNLKASVDSFGTALDTAITRIDKVEKQANTLEAIEKKSDKPQVQHSAAAAEAAALESRLAALERSQHSGASTTLTENQARPRGSDQSDAANARDLKNLSDQLVELREYINSVNASLEEIPGLIGETIGETVESKLGLIKSRLAVVETSLTTVQQSQNHSVERIRKQDQEILDAKNSLIGAAAGSAVDIINSRSLFAPATLEDKVTTSLNSLAASIMKHIDALTLATENLQHRMDNLNTSELHAAIVNTLNQIYPSLRHSESTFQSLNSQLSAMDFNIKSLQKQLEEVRESKQAQVTPASAPIKQDDAALQRLRSKVDELAQHNIQIRGLGNDYAAYKEKIANELQVIRGHITDLSEVFASSSFELKNSGEELAGNVESFKERFKGLETKVDTMAQKLQHQTLRASSASLPRTVFRGSATAQPPPAASTRQASTTSNRQPSTSSETSAVKRKHHQVNGNGSGPGTPKKTNGTLKSSRPGGSPKAKRTRHSKLDDDDDENRDYEDEGNPQPGISDPEDEGLPELPPLPKSKSKTQTKVEKRDVIDLLSD